MRRRVVLLGATGSIGRQACDVIARHPRELEIVGAVGGSDVAAMEGVVSRFGVPHAAVVRPTTAPPAGWGTGMDAACDVAALDADVVLVAITGAAALAPAMAAIERGRAIALATKEVMVMAGALVTEAARRSGSVFLPVDSEHSALWQCLRGEDPASVSRLILTASGGPFRDRDPATFAEITVEQALRHPNWSMGPKVTVDSATMMNKGLEIIEAHFLFDIPYDRIDVVVHPPSLVHSMVQFCDGATMAQIGMPDMRVPIALALTGGARLPDVAPPAMPAATPPWEFFEVDTVRFPAVGVARRAGESGGAAGAVLNAANEVAVQAFLDRIIGYHEIVPLVAETVEAGGGHAAASLDDLVAADAWARRHAAERCGVSASG